MTILKTIILGAILGMLLSPSQSHAFVSNPSSQATESSVTPRLSVDPTGAIYLIWKKERDSQSGISSSTVQPIGGRAGSRTLAGSIGRNLLGRGPPAPGLTATGKGTYMPPGGLSIAMGRRTSSSAPPRISGRPSGPPSS